MGKLVYDGEDRPIILDDRTLAHLKVVMSTKLRRQESFTFSWTYAGDDTPGRSTIWLHPSIPLRFEFDSADPPQVNSRWIAVLMESASSTGGIRLVDEVIDAPE